MSEHLFNKLKVYSRKVFWKAYYGLDIKSITNNVHILAEVTVRDCKIIKMLSLKFTKFLVIEGLNDNEPVIGMDLLTKIPGLKDKLNDIRELSEEYT